MSDQASASSSRLNGTPSQPLKTKRTHPNGTHSAGSKRRTMRSAKQAVNVEIRLHADCSRSSEEVTMAVKRWIKANVDQIECDSSIQPQRWQSEEGLQGIRTIKVAEGEYEHQRISLERCRLRYHVWQSPEFDTVEELAAAEEGEGEGDDVMAATVTELPSSTLEGAWESLIYASDIKQRLLNYIHTTLLFAQLKVDPNIVSCNKVCLLHGPPGTGKTTLCRALAQKLSIRLTDRYSHGKLIEINSHSLFSKWFSESGKLVQRLFSMVAEMISDPDGFVIILIDEVESLTAARSAAQSGTEPGDAVRVVNAMLTQLDKLRQEPNVLVMTTSNISDSIDNAFIDRADIKAYIGPPPPEAIYWILRSCLEEMMDKGLAERTKFADYKTVHKVVVTPIAPQAEVAAADATRDSLLEQGIGVQESIRLVGLAKLCEGVSGRTLRRLPILAHAQYVANQYGFQRGEAPASDADPDSVMADEAEEEDGDEAEESDDEEEAVGGGLPGSTVPMMDWLAAMSKALEQSQVELSHAKRGGASTAAK